MPKNLFSRREFLHLGALAAAGAAGSALVASCAPAVTPEVIEKEVEVTRIVEGEKVVETVVEKVAETVVVTQPPAAEEKTIECWIMYQPTEWVTRTAEHPVVCNASRVLAEQFMAEFPHVRITWTDAPSGMSTADFAAYLTARIAGGDAPDLQHAMHWIPIQNGWAMPIEEYLDQPNPYAPEYDRWRDIYYERLMTSCVQPDGHEYIAPIRTEWPYVKYWLVYNADYFQKQGLEPFTTWTGFKEISATLKEMGSGLSPWPFEAVDGNLWPLALQILPPLMQKVCVEMDLNGDFFVNTEEGLAAWRKGLIKHTTPLYRVAWREMYELAKSWVDGFATSDLELMWRQEKVHLRCEAQGSFTSLYYDPTIEFQMNVIVPPFPTSEDIPPTADMSGASDPDGLTAGDGTVPAEHVTSLQAPGNCMLEESIKAHDNLEETLRWWQFTTTPENCAFAVNENQEWIPAAKDAPLGPLYTEVAKAKLPTYNYQIEWWGMGLYWDAAHFVNWRRIFTDWVTGAIDEEAFFERENLEGEEGAERYAATLNE